MRHRERTDNALSELMSCAGKIHEEVAEMRRLCNEIAKAWIEVRDAIPAGEVRKLTTLRTLIGANSQMYRAMDLGLVDRDVLEEFLAKQRGKEVRS